MAKLPFTWHGDGPPLVLISGLGGKGTSWQSFLGEAARHFRVLTFDNLGAGVAPRLPAGATIRDLIAEELFVLEPICKGNGVKETLHEIGHGEVQSEQKELVHLSLKLELDA